MEAPQTKEMGRTRSVNDIILEAKSDPFLSFKKWPIHEVRTACLKTMKSRYPCITADWMVDWLESVITELNAIHDPVGRDLLEWYIFGSYAEIVPRAIEFAYSVLKKNTAWINIYSKMITGKLLKKEHPSVCTNVPINELFPSIDEFLRLLIAKLLAPRSSTGYFEENWVCAERALRIIMSYELTEYLELLEEYISLYKTGKIQPSNTLPPFQKDLNLAMFIAAKRILVKAKKKNK